MKPFPRSRVTTLRIQIAAVAACALAASNLLAQVEVGASDPSTEQEPAEEQATESPERVAVNPVVDDDAIALRLQRILQATQWFESPSVRVDQGVVFLSGSAQKQEQRDWASQLARSTEEVVAVVNRIAVKQPSAFDLAPARAELDRLVRDAVELLPSATVALVVLFLAYWAARAAYYGSRFFAARRIDSKLLQQMVARAVAVPVAVIGLYLALRVSGLTRLAATVLGGTGLVGLAVGIAFRDIAENYLASLLISMKRPFRMGDLIQVDDKQGFVQSVTTRGTMLMTLEGNHIQIPNALIYKSVIHNITANPNTRFDFTVGIDYGDSISDAQQVILEAMNQHEAVLSEPATLVLVESLAASTVNLQALFWVDTARHSGLKVRSAVIRLVKQALEEAGFTLPDEAREVIFPRGVPVLMEGAADQGGSNGRSAAAPPRRRETRAASLNVPGPTAEPTATPAEGRLASDREEVQRQADLSSPPDAGENLLEP